LEKGLAYFDIGGYQVSPDNTIICYGIDTVSRRNYTLYFKDLTTGKIFDDRIENTVGYAVWANDNKTVFYTKRDPQTLRDCYIYRHVLGTDSKSDVLGF
jgi:oligopeptidase B